MANTTKLNYDRKALASVINKSANVVNYDGKLCSKLKRNL
jgi:hypothetical protein